jgi:hypothetical protein
MKKRTSKILGILLAFLMIVPMVNAQTPDQEKLNQLSQEYNLKDVKTVPKDALRFDSVDEYEQFLKQITAATKNAHEEFLKGKLKAQSNQDTNNFDTALIVPYATSTTSQSKSRIPDYVPYPILVNCYIRYDYTVHSNGYNIFSSLKSYDTYTTGTTFGHDWTERDFYYEIIDGRRTLSASVFGTMDVTAVVQGNPKLFTYQVFEVFEFYAAK